MNYELVPLAESHRTAVVSIFNFFIEHSFAAYPDQTVGPDFFDRILAMATGYPSVAVLAPDGDVVGFAFLRPFNPASTFRRTAEIGYFILPDHTGKGLGARILERFFQEARALGIDNILASISAFNQGSIRFHARHGFEPCGHFKSIGRKFGQDFDVVWMQKRLS